MRIYLAGPMSGIPHHNYPAFTASAARIRQRGHVCANPAELHPDTTHPWAYYLRRDIAELVQCDAVAVLPGWRNSRGAQLEVTIAAELDMPVLNEFTWLPEPISDLISDKKSV